MLLRSWLAAALFLVALAFVWRSFYRMRIGDVVVDHAPVEAPQLVA